MRWIKHFTRVALAGGAFFSLSHAQTPQLQGRFYAEKDSYMVGEPVLFKVEIKNIGNKVEYLNAKSPSSCLDTYDFSVAGPGSVCTAKWNPDCHDELLPLMPGDLQQGKWPLNFWFQFEHAGTYEVTATRHIPVMSQGGAVEDYTFSTKFPVNLTPVEPARVQQILQEFELKLSSTDPEVRHAALDVLASTAPAYFQSIALRISRSKDDFAVLHSVGALERINTAETRSALGDLLTNEEPANQDEVLVRIHAIEALGHDGDPSYQSLIGRFLEDKNEYIQQNAMAATAQLGKAEAVSQLQRYAFSSNPVTRRNVASALKFSLTPGAVEALIDLLADKDSSVREEALKSLGILTGHSADGASPEQVQNLWRAWWRKNKEQFHFAGHLEFLCHMQ